MLNLDIEILCLFNGILAIHFINHLATLTALSYSVVDIVRENIEKITIETYAMYSVCIEF